MGINSKDRRDYYYYQAKVLGYRARSAFKLLDIDDEFKILDSANNIVDLCAAPGSWSQVLAQKKNRKILSIDVQEIAPIDGVVTLKEDITSDSCLEKINSFFGRNKVDLVICDGAPDVTGFHDLDEFLQADLLKASLSICTKIAKEGSSFVGKCFRGEFSGYILSHFENFYEKVEYVKPKSSRGNSVECFIICRGLKITDADPFEINVDIKPKAFMLKSVGSGPDPDFTEERSEIPLKPVSDPINPPYAKSIQRKKNRCQTQDNN